MQENDLTGKATILLVDDVPDDLAMMSSLLTDLYKIKLPTVVRRP